MTTNGNDREIIVEGTEGGDCDGSLEDPFNPGTGTLTRRSNAPLTTTQQEDSATICATPTVAEVVPSTGKDVVGEEGGNRADRTASVDKVLEDASGQQKHHKTQASAIPATGMRKKIRKKRAAKAVEAGAIAVSPTAGFYRGLRRSKHKSLKTGSVVIAGTLSNGAVNVAINGNKCPTVTWTRGMVTPRGSTIAKPPNRTAPTKVPPRGLRSPREEAMAISGNFMGTARGAAPIISNPPPPILRGLRKNQRTNRPDQSENAHAIEDMEQGNLHASIPEELENATSLHRQGSNAVVQIHQGDLLASIPNAQDTSTASLGLNDQLPPGSNPSHGNGSALTSFVESGTAVSNAGLAVAQPVEDGGNASLVQAVEVDAAEIERKESEKKKNRECIAIGVVLIAIALTVLLGTIFGRSSTDPTGLVAVPTVAPSMASSESPSSAPTGLLDFLLENLPSYMLENLKNSSTPQWHAQEWLYNHPKLPGMEEWRKEQLFALATFYHAMEGPNWPEAIRDDWMQYDKPECFWHSSEFGDFVDGGKRWEESTVYNMTPCNENQEIQFLLLSRMKLSSFNPHIPPEIALLTALSVLALPLNDVNASITEFLPTELFQMTNLTVLNLHSNSLSSPVPSELGLMTSMAGLSLSNNELTGHIPSEIGLMTSMADLYFFSNNLSGPIPSEVGELSTMVDLGFSGNALMGPIPSEVGLMTSMTQLYLYSNNLSGPIPSEVGEISTMVDLALDENTLTGHIPSEMGLMTSMTRLYLYSNNLSCPIPSEVGEISTMVDLGVNWNALTGLIPSEVGLMTSMTKLYLFSNNLSGPIPSEVGMVSSMVDLVLNLNSLTGHIPTEVGLMTSVALLYLYSNNLSGPIPSEVGVISTMVDLALDENELTGLIPSEVGLMTRVALLYLYSNNLSGSIPSEVGDISTMVFLGLHDNALTGLIPSEVGLMTSVAQLYFFSNNLSGPIPSEVGVISTMVDLALYENELTGLIPSEIGLMTSMTDLYLFSNHLSGPIPSELGEISAMVGLALYENALTGHIPSEVGLMSNMAQLSLFSNNLSGPIPSEVGQIAHMETLSLRMNSLSGSLPSEIGLMSQLQDLRFENNTLSGEIPQELMPMNGTLTTVTLANNSFSGVILESFCSLGMHNSTVGLGLSFDCSDQLCGCYWCACGLASEIVDNGTHLEGVIGGENNSE